VDGAHGHQRCKKRGRFDDKEAQVRVLARQHQSDEPGGGCRTDLNGDTGVG